MSQETLPEIQVATEALESRITITEGEVGRMKEEISGKRRLLRALRKALVTINPRRATAKRRVPGTRKPEESLQAR